MARPSRFSPEVRERAVRMVLEHTQDHASQWTAITSIAEKIGCAAETLRKWVRQAERDSGQRPGLTTDERVRLGLAAPWAPLGWGPFNRVRGFSSFRPSLSRALSASHVIGKVAAKCAATCCCDA